MEPWKAVRDYHQITKHYPQRYARSPGHMDWANQPNPFRRFEGAPLIDLPLGWNRSEPAYDALYGPELPEPQAVNRTTLGAFFEHALALSAWKEYLGARWALRINPSSGNLHPTEGYLVLPAIDGIHQQPGVYHYAPQEHGLERRAEFSRQLWAQFTDGFPPATFFVGLSSIHWREAWKYGERAYRYCQHDAGHALAALSLSAAMLGWPSRMLAGVSDAELSALLGLDRDGDYEGTEGEYPDLVLAIFPTRRASESLGPATLPAGALAQIAGAAWAGRANRLSTQHARWELIDSVADACHKSATSPTLGDAPLPASSGALSAACRPHSAGRIIRRRRSAVDMDGRTAITTEQFFVMLDRTLPLANRVPFNTLGAPVCTHLALFVHRVEGLRPGVYFLVRAREELARLREAMRPDFAWKKPAGCPDSLPLYHLMAGDCRQIAGHASCGQAIAADGAFSLGMIVAFEGTLRRYGAWFYRRLFWEAGAIGQVLYLEAEGAGVRATGIGCFFDDPVHELLGLQGMTYQSLYHFTVGGPVEDSRLTTRPPYPAERYARAL